jgi:hypothetical protein
MKQSKNIIEVELSFRLVNFDFNGFDQFQLADNILLRKMLPQELNAKYPIKSIYIGLGEIEAKSWDNHLIEAVMNVELPEIEVEKVYRVEQTYQYQNLIIQPFLYNGLLSNSMTYATHYFIKNKEQKTLCSLGYKGYNFFPDKLDLHQLESISKTYNIIGEANLDNILNRALNRLFIALKEDLHSPNMVNSPNWDKILDLVISLETILLSSKNTIKTELTYRFKLNGASLLWDVTGYEKRKIFEVLGNVYEIRSKIVHGGDDKKIVSEIDKILHKLNIIDNSGGNGVGKLLSLSNLLEGWIRLLVEKIVKIPIDKRPYKIEGGWEELIWKE